MSENERAELRRKIAAELGWRVERQKTMGDTYWVVFRPDGSIVEKKTWSMSIAAWGIESTAWEQVPDWTTDLNAAFTLVGDYNGFVLELQQGVWRAAFMWHDVTLYANTAAEAICVAWLKYRKVLKEVG